MASVEEADPYFKELIRRFLRDSNKAFTDQEDAKALLDMVKEWERLGPRALHKLAMGEIWNFPLYISLASAILNRREINGLRRELGLREA
jgi:hypothetical protein